MPTNEDLIPLALAGDQDAYTKLFKNLKPLVGKISWRYFKGSVDGEDYECNALSHILMRLNKFDGNAKFTTWATRVAINQALEYLRRGKTEREQTVHYDDAVDPDNPESVTFAASMADKRNGYARVEAQWDTKKVLDHMRPDDRDILVAKVFHGFSMEELATAKRKTIPAVKSDLLRAKERAREIMEGLENGSIEGLSTDSEEGIERNPLIDRIVQESPSKTLYGTLRPKICVCGCGKEFMQTGTSQKYIPGHRPDQVKGASSRRRGTSLPAAVPIDPLADVRVTISVSTKALDRLILMLPAKLKATAVERLLEGL